MSKVMRHQFICIFDLFINANIVLNWREVGRIVFAITLIAIKCLCKNYIINVCFCL